jgi:lysophospholipase L1-like esterase
MIGSQKSGTMVDNHNEGHPGYTIDQVSSTVDQDFILRPNIVLLMAGTNDINQALDLSNAPTRLSNLIDKLVTNLPDAVILVAQLTPLAEPDRQASRNTFNAALPGVISTYANAGQHVMLVNTSHVTTSDLSSDGIHPNDKGYSLLADSWFASLQTANANGWIHPPVTVPTSTPLATFSSSTITTTTKPSTTTTASSVNASIIATTTSSGGSVPTSTTKSSLAKKRLRIEWNGVAIWMTALVLGFSLL